MREITKILILTAAAVAVIWIAAGISSAGMFGYGRMMSNWQGDRASWSDSPAGSCLNYGSMMGGFNYGGNWHGMMYRNSNAGAFCPASEVYGANSTPCLKSGYARTGW